MIPVAAKGRSTVAVKGLAVEENAMRSSPPEFVIAKPHPSDILEWFYCIQGPPGTPYEGGLYIGRVSFPGNYPFSPPTIRMITPSGRFEINKPICLSISNYHPESWNPVWTIHTILIGLLAFMVGTDSTQGAITTTEEEKRKLAAASREQISNPSKNQIAYPVVTTRGTIDIMFQSKNAQAISDSQPAAPE